MPAAPLLSCLLLAFSAWLLACPAEALRTDLKPRGAKVSARLCAAEHGAFHSPPKRRGKVKELGDLLKPAAAEEGARGILSGNTSSRFCKSSRDFISYLEPLLLPKFKLAFCYVPKAACTNFKDLFNYLNGFGLSSLGYGHDYTKSMPRQIHIDRSFVTKANGWRFAAFTRDPLLRYLSAFGSNCVGDQREGFEHEFECCGNTSMNNLPPELLVRSFEARVRHDSEWGLVQGDGHWVSQTELIRNCGWDDFEPNNLDFRGHFSGDVNSQVKEMLRMVGFENDTVVDRFFPVKGWAGHRNTIKRPSAREFYRDPEIVEKAMGLYKDDYRLLPGVGCSFTEWVRNRTGLRRG